MRLFILLFGLVAYVFFLGTFLYLIGFVESLLVPKAINDGTPASLGTAIIVNTGLVLLFAVQHTIMARLKFKAWWTTIVPQASERSIFLIATCGVLVLLYWQWQPLPGILWSVEADVLRYALWGLSGMGWLLVFYSSFLINHFDLFGLRQVWLYFRGQEYTQIKFKDRLLYHWVRHPLMLGFLIAMWATPHMTQGHLLFAALFTVYILIGVTVEERTLVAIHGDDYRKYQARVSRLIPRPPRSV